MLLGSQVTFVNKIPTVIQKEISQPDKYISHHKRKSLCVDPVSQKILNQKFEG